MTVVKLDDLLTNQRVETNDSQLVIQMPNKKLPVGQHKFQLTVEDDSNNQSQPAQITVIIIDTTAPTAIVELNDAQGRLVTDGRISYASDFILNGKNSIDVGGSIVNYIWELIPQ